MTSNRLREIFSDFDFTKIIGMCADWTKSDDKGNPNPSFNLKTLGEGRETHRQNWFSWMMRMWIDDNGVLVLYRPSEYIATKSIIKIWNHLTNFLIKKGIQEKIQLYIVNNNCSRVNSVVQYPQEFFQIKKDKQKIESYLNTVDGKQKHKVFAHSVQWQSRPLSIETDLLREMYKRIDLTALLMNGY